MNWDDTRIFLAVARHGQLLAAARALAAFVHSSHFP